MSVNHIVAPSSVLTTRYYNPLFGTCTHICQTRSRHPLVLTRTFSSCARTRQPRHAPAPRHHPSSPSSFPPLPRRPELIALLAPGYYLYDYSVHGRFSDTSDDRPSTSSIPKARAIKKRPRDLHSRDPFSSLDRSFLIKHKSPTRRDQLCLARDDTMPGQASQPARTPDGCRAAHHPHRSRLLAASRLITTLVSRGLISPGRYCLMGFAPPPLLTLLRGKDVRAQPSLQRGPRYDRPRSPAPSLITRRQFTSFGSRLWISSLPLVVKPSRSHI